MGVDNESVEYSDFNDIYLELYPNNERSRDPEILAAQDDIALALSSVYAAYATSKMLKLADFKVIYSGIGKNFFIELNYRSFAGINYHKAYPKHFHELMVEMYKAFEPFEGKFSLVGDVCLRKATPYKKAFHVIAFKTTVENAMGGDYSAYVKREHLL